MGSLRVILEALSAQIAIEVARPENDDGSGGTSFAVDVAIGTEHLSRHQGANGRVVLTLHEDGDDEIGPPKFLNGTLRSLYTWKPALAAYLWVPVGQAGERQILSRLDAIESLIRCVLRALYETFHGATLPDQEIPSTANVLRAARHMRHGESAIIPFSVGVPVTKGRTLTTLPAGATLAVNLRVNPES